MSKGQPMIPENVINNIGLYYGQNSGIPLELEVRFSSYSNDFGKSAKNKKKGISARTFYRVKKIFDPNDNVGVKSITKDSSANINGTTIRKTTHSNGMDSWLIKEPLAIGSDDRGSYINNDYRFRVALSQEIPLASDDPRIQLFNKVEPANIVVRDKTRWSYTLGNGNFRVDMTTVQMEKLDPRSGRRDNISEFEIEVELLRSEAIDKLPAAISQLLLIVHGTNRLYTQKEFTMIVDYVNDTLRSPHRTCWSSSNIDNRVLFNARNLHFNDIVYGGLVGGKNDETYTITHKADGLRKLLVFHTSGIWLVMSPDEANLVVRPTGNVKNSIDGLINLFVGTILDGELIPMNDPRTPDKNVRLPGAPAEKYWYLIFDALAGSRPASDDVSTMTGDRHIQQQAHDFRRRELGNGLVRFFREVNPLPGLFTLNSKSFTPIVNVNELFETIKVMEMEAATEGLIKYKTDGFVFTPNKMPYDSCNDQITPLKKRVLGKYADICKWKPSQRLTIDFGIVYRIGTPPFVLSVSASKGGRDGRKGKGGGGGKGGGKGRSKEVIIFQGSDFYPFNYESQINYDNDLLKDIRPGAVVEFGWEPKNDDPTDSWLVPHLIRSDKNKPNAQDVAIDTWNLIHDPITIETLKGETLRLMRKYHNRIKKGLFQQAVIDYAFKISGKKVNYFSVKAEKGPTLLDIGSGRGGDVSKWVKYRRIVAVEPNPEHIEELKKRINSFYNQETVQVVTGLENLSASLSVAEANKDRVIIVQTGGQDFELINNVVIPFLNGQADVVAFMLSLTFFWQSATLVNDLTNTIVMNLKKTGQVIYLTMDGSIVEQMFDPAFGERSELRQLASVKDGSAMTGGGAVVGGVGGGAGAGGAMGVGDLKMNEVVEVQLAEASLNYYKSKHELHIHISGTIVEDQTEWLVYLNDLWLRLDQHGFKLNTRHRADKEKLLNPSEMILSSMYTYGTIVPK